MRISKEQVYTFVRFAMVGVACTGIHYMVYYLLLTLMNCPHNVAFTLGYLLGFIANFFLTAWFTFAARPTWSRLAGMGLAHLSNYVVQIVLLNLFLWVGLDEVIAPIPVYAISIPVNFLLVRFVFTHKKDV